MRTGILSTGQLVSRLNAAGLRVTANMLKQDVRDGYLAHRILGPAEEQYRGWDRGAVRRAFHLYRLRRLGMKGDLARLYLFFRDGWGWKSIQPICLDGMRKGIDLEAMPVRRHLRRITPRGLDTLAEDIAPDAQMSESVARIVWGMGFFGQPLPGGTLMGIYDGLHREFGFEIQPGQAELAESIISDLGLTWDHQIAIVARANALTAELARQIFLSFVRTWRRAFRRKMLEGTGPKSQTRASTNLLSAFGVPQEEMAAYFRQRSGRVTPAQLLAALFCPTVVVAGLLQQGLVATRLLEAGVPIQNLVGLNRT